MTTVTALAFTQFQNAEEEGTMPILLLGLIALAAFGSIGILLALAVSLEHKKKINTTQPHSGRVA